MKALVTGASGFIGSHLVEALLQRGAAVRALVRGPQRLRWIEGIEGVEYCCGTLEDAKSLGEAVRGVDVVFHTAGVVKALSKGGFFKTNADGTERLLRAVERHNRDIRRFVFVSSQAAAGPGSLDQPLDEDAPPRPISPYGQSKLVAEGAVLDRRDRLPVAVVRPPAVYGPRDAETLTFFRLAKRGLVLIPGFGRRRLSLVYVDDLVRGLIAAAEHPAAAGKTFYLTSGEHDWSELAGALQRAVGRGWKVRVPAAALYAAGAAGECFGRLLRRPVSLTLAKARELTQRAWLCSDARARRLLGYEPQWTLEEGIATTAAWYRAAGWI